MEQRRKIEEQQRRSRAMLELSLVLPMAGAAAGAVVVGTTLLTGGGALGEGATIVAGTGSKLIQFPIRRVLITAAAANAAIYQAAAAPVAGAGSISDESGSGMGLVYIEG